MYSYDLLCRARVSFFSWSQDVPGEKPVSIGEHCIAYYCMVMWPDRLGTRHLRSFGWICWQTWAEAHQAPYATLFQMSEMKKCSCPACHSINGWFFCFASCNGSKFASQSCKSHEAAATRTCISHISLQPFEVTNAAILASPRFQIVYGVRSVHLGQGGVMMKAQMPRKRHQVSLCENCISIKLYDVAIIYESQKYCRACATRNICKRATWKKNSQ